MRYMKKRVEVDAWKYENNLSEAPDWVKNSTAEEKVGLINFMTPDGFMSGKPGDWIVRDETGVVWPMDGTYFENFFIPTGE